MPVSALDDASKTMGADVASRFSALMSSPGAIHAHVSAEIGHWQTATRSVLDTQFPLRSHLQAFLEWQAAVQAGLPEKDRFDKAVDDYALFCKAIRQPATEAFWKRQSGNEDRAISTRLLLEHWQRQMDQARAAWEMAEIALRRAALMEQLNQLLHLLQALHEKLRALGLDTGILLDLAAGKLTPQDIRQLERWFTYLSEDKGMRALCELLGKMRQVALSDRVERVRSRVQVATVLPDVDSREEIVGIRLGRDIEHLLPSELALLADPETALLFDLKYVESSLMCFDMQGMQNIATHVEAEEDRSIEEDEKQGPMIICVDTSGSMNGMPETIAKAVALYFAAQAREQQRPCYLINFSTQITTLDLSGDVGLASVLQFLQMSFHGGTDVAPALEHALHTIEQATYKNADVLIVSDFVMAGLPESTLARIDRRRVDGNKFHSLVVAACYMTHRLESMFDNEWIVEPGSGRVHELVNFERKVRQS